MGRKRHLTSNGTDTIIYQQFVCLFVCTAWQPACNRLNTEQRVCRWISQCRWGIGFRMWCKVQSAWHLLSKKSDGDTTVLEGDLEYEVQSGGLANKSSHWKYYRISCRHVLERAWSAKLVYICCFPSKS